ncbi:MAG: hypothetical protein GTO46_00420 [Gemmatimonadetes bacterium]|nr:hypothetical protein [Gemmatimonadota bacterium]NIO30254.1 hypothetical protein [Gemmatimonadota bacterium]
MKLRIPLSVIVPFLLLGLLALLSCGGISSEKLAGLDEDVGVLEGVVHLVGVPCPPTSPQLPPCDGPYPGYSVIVHDSRGENVVAQTRADDRGFYHLELKAGKYIIFTIQGLHEQFTEANDFTIVAGKITVLNLTIDYGIRSAATAP